MLDQGSPGWVKERIGKLTASRMGDVMAMTKAGKPSEARLSYLKQLVAERMEGVATDFYVTPAMQWGIDHEAPAAELYECVTGEILMPAKWEAHPEIEYFGATPDRLLGDDALVEIKCPTTPVYIEWIRTQEIPERYRWQMTAQLACTRRRWCDFVAYNPRVLYGSPIWIKRFEPTAEEIAKCESAARDFLLEVDRLFDLVTREAA